jgi:hypothetical protein
LDGRIGPFGVELRQELVGRILNTRKRIPQFPPYFSFGDGLLQLFDLSP